MYYSSSSSSPPPPHHQPPPHPTTTTPPPPHPTTTTTPNHHHRILEERGLLDSITNDALRSACSNAINLPLKVYCRFDPTAESLHLGNLLGLIVLSWFRRPGHKVVALIGGATARVGDLSGKSLERPELDVEALERNTASIENTIRTILGRAQNQNLEKLNVDGKEFCDSSVVVLNNYDWWKEFSLLEFLKRVGRYARVGSMIAKESVRKRLDSEQGMSYTEFTYQLLQGYDFLHLFQNEGVNVQIGGSDQWCGGGWVWWLGVVVVGCGGGGGEEEDDE